VPRYLISFDDGWMDFPESDLPAVGKAAHDVMFEAQAAGVWITGGGLHTQQATVVDPSGAISLAPPPDEKIAIGGFSIIDVATRAEAEQWAARIAKACRTPQEVREIMRDDSA